MTPEEQETRTLYATLAPQERDRFLTWYARHLVRLEATLAQHLARELACRPQMEVLLERARATVPVLPPLWHEAAQALVILVEESEALAAHLARARHWHDTQRAALQAEEPR